MTKEQNIETLRRIGSQKDEVVAQLHKAREGHHVVDERRLRETFEALSLSEVRLIGRIEAAE